MKAYGQPRAYVLIEVDLWKIALIMKEDWLRKHYSRCRLYCFKL